MLLGRTRELDAIATARRGAEAGHGAAVVVHGEPGIGKTALLAAVADDALDGWTVVRASGVEAEQAVPLATVQALLWPLRADLGELAAGQSALLRGVLALGPQDPTSPFAIGAAVLSLLSVASGSRPVLAIVDDVHWADAASQEVLTFVGRRLDHERVVLLLGARTDEAGELLANEAFVQVPLGPLEADDARSLAEGSAGAQLDAAALERLLAVCAGNPLGLVELTGRLAEHGEDVASAALAAGPLVQRSFAARVDRLGEETRSVLLLLAAAGEPSPVLDAVGDDARARLAEAEAAGVLAAGGAFDFRHPLMRTAVYGAATPPERRAAHRRLAEVLTGARRAWQLAEAADGPDEEAARALEAAAAESGTVGGVAAEAVAFERAAALSAVPEARATRLLAAGRAWRRAGRVERSNAVLAAALGPAGDAPVRARIQLERGLNLLRDGERRNAYELLTVEAERAAGQDAEIAARLYAAVTLAVNVDVEGPSAMTYADRAVELARGSGGEAELDALFAAVSARMSRPAPPDETDDRLVGRAADLLHQPALRTGEQPHWIAYALAELEQDDDARRLSDLALAEARVAGDVWSLCYGLYARAIVELVLGRIDSARAWSAEALPLAEQIGERWRLDQARIVDVEIEAARGVVPAPEDDAHLHVGRALLAAGRAEEATPHLEAAVRAFEVETPRAWYRLAPLDLAEAHALADRPKDAAALLRAAAPAIEACRLRRPRARLARVEGLLASEGKVDLAFARAAALLEEAPHPLEEARLALNHGERLAQLGRSSDSVLHLEQAAARFDALGAAGWFERARDALERAAGSARPAPSRRTDVLSAQELRVARHAASGARDREIAALLYLSPRTIESYLQSAYRKLGVSNRTQLASVLAADRIDTREVP